MQGPIALLVSDPAVLSSLKFALSIEGYHMAAAEDHSAARALVIDQTSGGGGLAELLALRAAGTTTPAIVLATHPTASFRDRAAGAGALVIEKPLLGDELTNAISSLLKPRKAA